VAAHFPRRRTARVYWFSHLAPPLFELPDSHIDPLEHVERFEPRHDDRDMEFFRRAEVLLVPHHRADMSCREKALHPICGGGEECVDGGGTRTWEQRSEKLPSPSFFAWYTAIGWRGRGLKPHAKKTTFISGFSRAIFYSVERRIDHPDLSPSALTVRRSFDEPGSGACRRERGEETSLREADCLSPLSMISSGVTQTGQPGPCTSVSAFGGGTRYRT